jgi:hypothetical protein
MKKLVIVFFIICPIEFFGQTFVTKQPLRMPNKYQKPTFKTIADLKTTADLSNMFWNVWIDRKGVTTTNGQIPKFMERFLVVEEKDSKIHIVKDNGAFNNSMGEFTNEPTDYGWIGKEFCILSPFAIYSSKTNFRLKVMTVTTPEMMQKEMARIRDGAKKLAFYDSPGITTPNDNETPLFEIFYVLKREGGRYLLSKRENISKGFSENFVNGWVDTASVQLWEQRQSLEPNWDSDAAAERQKENVKSSVFSNKEQAEIFATSKNGKAFWDDDRYTVRYSPYFKRFPVFSQSGNIVETAVVSDLVQEDGKTVKNDAMVEIQELYNVQKQKSRNINLVFVIDGTQSMGPYIESVRKAVIESAASIQSSDNNFNYGAVIYRDYIKPENDECYMVQQLTDYNKFSKFMVTVDTEEPACRDKTASEGLYMGMKKVDGILRGKEQQTNIIILIGDCGDRDGEGRITETDVLPLLKKYGCSILAMQVHSNVDQSYEDFIYQAKDIGLKNAVEISFDQKQKYGKLNMPALNNQPRWQEKSIGKKSLYTLKFSPVSGGLQITTKKGEIISEKEVNEEIKRIISSTDVKNDSMLNELTKMVNSSIVADPTKESGLSAEGLQILMKAGFSMEQINILKQKNYQFMLRGNTAIKIQSMKTPLYNYVLFLDQAELDDVKISLDKLYTPGQTAYERRVKLSEAWKQLLISNYGVTRAEMENKTLAELMAYITGLPSLNPLLLKYTMNDIEDKIKLPDDEFDGIINQIKTKRDELNRISGNKAFMFLSNDLAYYWIPQRSLP